MKKTALIIIALLTLFFTECVSAQTENKEVELLKALGIIDEQMIDSQEIVTRGEFAEHIQRFMAVDFVSDVYDASFADVTEYSPECNSVYFLKSRNILTGAGDGNFYPDAPVTKKQAAIVMARVLGYGIVSKNIESYASKLGIIEMTDDSLNHGELVSLMYKALDCECVVVNYTNATDKYELKENYLLETFGVNRGRGVIKSNSTTTLDGTGAVFEGMTLIGNHELQTASVNIEDLLGMNVDYYYISASRTEDDTDTLICVFPTNVNKVIEIEARNIISFDGKIIKYSEDNRSKTITVDSSVDVIYNGVACPDYEVAMLSPQSGKLTYIENGTGIDCIKVDEYINGIVSSVSDEYIYLKNGDRIEFDTFDDDKLFLYDDKGNKVEDVPVNSVLSMYYSSDRKYLKAVYSINVLEAVKISKVDEESVTVDEKAYYVNKRYLNWGNAIKNSGDATYRIYLDACGEVARIEKASGGVTFGYILSVYENGGSGEAWIKILVEDGEIENFECASKMSIDGERKIYNKQSIESKLYAEDTIEQLVTYQTDSEGKINTIDTASNRTTFTDSVADKEIDEFKISYKADSDEYYKTATKVFGTSCPIDELTKVFFVSDNPKSQSEEYYWTGSISALENDDKAASAVGYKTTSQFGNAEAMVVYGSATSGNIGNETRISVVKDFSTVVNEDDELRTRVTFITGGKLVAYNLSDDVKIEDYNLSKGDLVRFAIDRNYEVSKLEMLCDVKEDGTMALRYGESNEYCSTTNVGGAVFRIVSGSVYDYEDGLMCISKGDVNGIDLSNPRFEYYRGIADAFICVVDENEITAGTDADIVRYVDNPNEYSRVFITTRYGAVRDVVLYK